MVASPKVQLPSEEKEHLSLNTSSFSASDVFFWSFSQPLIFLSPSIDFFHPSTRTAGTFLCFSSRSFFVITRCHSVLLCLTSPAVALMVAMIVALRRVELWMSAAAIGRSAAAEWQWNDPVRLWQLCPLKSNCCRPQCLYRIIWWTPATSWLTIIWQNRQ